MWDADVVIYFTFAVLCLSLFLLRYYRLSKAMRWVGIAHGINTISLATGQVMMMNGVKNNLFIFHFSLLFIYASYAVAYYFALSQVTTKRLILLSIGLFVLVSLGITYTIQPIDKYNSYAMILSYLLLIVLSLTYVYTLFSEVKIAGLEQDPMFWVSIGLLFTSLGGFFANGLMSYLIRESRQVAYEIYMVEELMSLLLVFTLIVALLADRLFVRK
jgi:hypothetical protein